MNKTCIIFLHLIGAMQGLNACQSVGIFRPSDPVISGIKYGNWGSRPYEYAWASTIVDIKNKRVIDLGVGLPSQYNWYKYAVKKLQPAFYAGIDCDERILREVILKDTFEIKHMDMSKIQYPNKSFDIAFCISTYEHIPYKTFMKSIQETYRILKDDGLLVITLDEEWDKNEPTTHGNGWNTLEQSLIENGLFRRGQRSFGLPEFLSLIKNYFTLVEDAIVDQINGIIYSKNGETIYYQRPNKDASILNSGSHVNSCVSYALLKKVLPS